jgi:AAA+ ATPase superfamily predicted ATPase
METPRRFIGRAEELSRLEKSLRQKDSQLIVVYGRRRVGKSTLLSHVCQGKSAFFFTGRKGEGKAALFARILKQLGDFFQSSLVAKAKVGDWSEVFEIIDIERNGRKIIIVFDEFQWMCAERTSLISALQEQWDKKWKGNGRVALILCGSIVSFMQRSVLSEKSPLYGRRTLSLEIEALPASAAKKFFPERAPVEQGEILMTLGGIPSYLEQLDREESWAQNLNRLALTQHGYLVNEVEFILREQLKTPKRYFLLLQALSKRTLSREDLAQALGIRNSGALNLYLDTLTALKLIKRVVPIGKKETGKAQRYAIWDEFLGFYFSFIGPNRELISMNADDWLYDRVVAPTWDSYCGYAFELFCMKNLKTVVSLLGIKEVFQRSGTFWQTQTAKREGLQIDMVIERTDQVTHLIECKWSRGAVGLSVASDIQRKRDLYPNPNGHTLKTALLTTHDITAPVAQSHAIDRVITLKEMLA